MSQEDDFAAALAQAQAAVAGMAEQYIGWVTADLERLDQAITRLDAANPAASLKGVYEVAHDIKGQGATFGYRLVTDIGALLCRYLHKSQERNAYDPAVIDAHVQALRTVIDNRVQGDAGELGKEILASLAAAAAR